MKTNKRVHKNIKRTHLKGGNSTNTDTPSSNPNSNPNEIFATINTNKKPATNITYISNLVKLISATIKELNNTKDQSNAYAEIQKILENFIKEANKYIPKDNTKSNNTNKKNFIFAIAKELGYNGYKGDNIYTSKVNINTSKVNIKAIIEQLLLKATKYMKKEAKTEAEANNPNKPEMPIGQENFIILPYISEQEKLIQKPKEKNCHLYPKQFYTALVEFTYENPYPNTQLDKDGGEYNSLMDIFKIFFYKNKNANIEWSDIIETLKKVKSLESSNNIKSKNKNDNKNYSQDYLKYLKSMLKSLYVFFNIDKCAYDFNNLGSYYSINFKESFLSRITFESNFIHKDFETLFIDNKKINMENLIYFLDSLFNKLITPTELEKKKQNIPDVDTFIDYILKKNANQLSNIKTKKEIYNNIVKYNIILLSIFNIDKTILKFHNYLVQKHLEEESPLIQKHLEEESPLIQKHLEEESPLIPKTISSTSTSNSNNKKCDYSNYEELIKEFTKLLDEFLPIFYKTLKFKKIEFEAIKFEDRDNKIKEYFKLQTEGKSIGLEKYSDYVLFNLIYCYLNNKCIYKDDIYRSGNIFENLLSMFERDQKIYFDKKLIKFNYPDYFKLFIGDNGENNLKYLLDSLYKKVGLQLENQEIDIPKIEDDKNEIDNFVNLLYTKNNELFNKYEGKKNTKNKYKKFYNKEIFDYKVVLYNMICSDLFSIDDIDKTFQYFLFQKKLNDEFEVEKNLPFVIKIAGIGSKKQKIKTQKIHPKYKRVENVAIKI
jgi:hypothetical protein